MSQSYLGQKRLRRYYGQIREVLEMPNLIEVQKSSYDLFLNSGDAEVPTDGEGIQGVFQSVFPIKDFNETAVLEFVKYELEAPKYDVEECQQRDMTYSAPLKVTLRLIVFDVDEDTGAKSVKDIKEQDVFMGDMPLMTQNGTFIVNGTERVIVSQMHRSPGVFFDHDKGKTHASGKLLFACRIIPYRGSWLDFEFDAKDIVFARIDRRRKLPVTTLLYALGLDQEAICDNYFDTVTYQLRKHEGWVTKFFPERIRGTRPTMDIVDADSGEVLFEASKKVTPRAVKKIIDEGKITEILVPFDKIVGRFVSKDIINEETGAIYVEAGDELTWETDKDGEVTGGTLKDLVDAGVTEIPVLDIDNINVGPYIRNTMAVDKNVGRDTALMDIYRVMRPGEPPTVEAASTLFDSLFFDSERYDLSAVGRVKMNMRLDLDAEDTQRTLRKEDIVSCIKALVDLRDGKGDDRRHRPPRQPPRALGRRAAGEPVPHRPGAHGACDQGAHERRRDRDADAARPDQRQARRGGGERVLRLVAALAVHGPDQPALGGHPQAAPLGAWPGRSDPRARRLRGARRAPDPLRPDLPDRDAGRPEHRPDRLAVDLRPGERVRLHRDALPQGRQRPGDRRGQVPVGPRREAPHDRPGQRRCSTRTASSSNDLVICPQVGRIHDGAAAKSVDLMDVSPKQLVSVAAALIPFLENDDANRALMGSNMQRQAVPLLQAEAPLVGTGMEGIVASDSGVAIGRAAAAIIDQVDATRIVIRATEDLEPGDAGGRHLQSAASSSARTRTPASTSVRW